jgi:hypothetical protein
MLLASCLEFGITGHSSYVPSIFGDAATDNGRFTTSTYPLYDLLSYYKKSFELTRNLQIHVERIPDWDTGLNTETTAYCTRKLMHRFREEDVLKLIDDVENEATDEGDDLDNAR